MVKAEKPVEVREAYATGLGRMIIGEIEDALKSPLLEPYWGKVQLIFTSPPFPLNHKKAYGNRDGEEYIEWLSGLARPLKNILKEDGSIAMEMGNSWEKGEPVMSTLALQSLLRFLQQGELKLCQQFICSNPARLPSPVQWVNVERIRVKDSFTHVWWMSPCSRPKADNRRVLSPYSNSMKKLFERSSYNSGKRPSGHVIGDDSFLKDNGGAIPSSVIEANNTRAHDRYLDHCRKNGITPHPARMPRKLAEFFIEFLTDPDDIVLDPFGGSNVTGSVAESLGRKWITVEPNEEYAEASRSRFTTEQLISHDG